VTATRGIHRFTFDSKVTPGQAAYYAENGFIVFANVLDDDDVQAIRDDARSLQARTLAGEIPADDVDDLTPPGVDADGRKILHRLPYFTRYSPTTRDIVTSERFQAIGAGLVGDHAWMLEDTFHGVIWQMKKGGKRSAYSEIRWHVDFEESHELVPVVSAGIYLDESHRRNGCLVVVPGSHVFPPGRLPPTAVPVEARPGDVVCHAYNILHASGPVLDEHDSRATLYLYFCGGHYPGSAKSFAAEERKEGIRSLFVNPVGSASDA
jgi:phytanoyl-CoA hydroxylase